MLVHACMLLLMLSHILPNQVADFGLSVVFNESRTHASNVFSGTPHFIAPETQVCDAHVHIGLRHRTLEHISHIYISRTDSRRYFPHLYL